MRKAAFTLGIILSIWLVMSAGATLFLLGDITNTYANNDPEVYSGSLTTITAIFIIPAIGAILATAFTLSKPRLAALLYVLGAALTIIIAGVSIASVYPLVMLILAGMTYISQRERQPKLKEASEG